jgi:hypothetical protein
LKESNIFEGSKLLGVTLSKEASQFAEIIRSSKSIHGEDEIRSANLNFVLGDISNQVVLGGVSLYPPVGATIAPGTETIRPIIGGSGEYQGAKGQVISKNLGDAGWSHILELD